MARTPEIAKSYVANSDTQQKHNTPTDGRKTLGKMESAHSHTHMFLTATDITDTQETHPPETETTKIF